MGLDPRFVLGHCDKGLCDSMTYVVPDDITGKEHGQQHPDPGIDEKEGIFNPAAKPRSQGLVDYADKCVKEYCGEPAENTDYE